MIITAGSTNVSLYVYFVDDDGGTAPGEPTTGALFSDIETGGSASYMRQGAVRTDFTLVTLASASAVHSDGGFILVDDTNMPGLYRVDVPDAAFLTGVDFIIIQMVMATANNSIMRPLLVDLTDVDLRDSVRGGMTALPNAAADAAGGLIISVAGSLDADAQAASVVEIEIDTGTTLQGELDGIQADTEDLQTQVGTAGAGLTNINLPNQTMDIVGNITGNLSGSVGSVTGAVGSVASGGITAASIATDAIGAAELAADAITEIATGVWDRDATTNQTAGTFGEALGDPAATGESIRQLVGEFDAAAAAGDPSTAENIMQYVKQIVNVLVGADGVTAFPAEAAPGSNVSLAEVISAIHADVTGLAGVAMRGTDSAATATSLTTAQNDLNVITGAAGVIIDDSTANDTTMSDAIWDEDATGHQNAGTFGESLGDPVATGESIRQLVGEFNAAAAAGDPSTAESIMQYVKQIVNVLVGSDGITAFPSEAAPGSNVSLAEVISAIHADTATTLNAAVIGNAQGADVATDVAAMIDVNNRVDVGSWLGTVVTSGTGGPDVNVNAVADVVTSAVQLEQNLANCFTGVASGTPTTTTMVSDVSIAVDNQFDGRIITFDDDTTTTNLQGQSTDITAGTASSNTLTFTALTTAPVSGDSFVIT